MKLAIVGATGVVGREALKIIEQHGVMLNGLRLFASARSAASRLSVLGRECIVEELCESSFDSLDVDVAIFSAGGDVSKKYAPIAAQKGITVIDNSSAFRMEPDVPLVVPEVNPSHIENIRRGIIANPNCSTIQAVVALKPLSDAYGLRRVVYSTYQAVSGAGEGGVRDLREGVSGTAPLKFRHPIYANVIPQIDEFQQDGYTKEEAKMVNETRKILGLPHLKITATTVRVPVYNSHSIAINIELESSFELDDVRKLLAQSPGIELRDEPARGIYPMPIDVSGRDEVFVGRIRRDFSLESGLNIWCVADNLRKGAALNALQIAQMIQN